MKTKEELFKEYGIKDESELHCNALMKYCPGKPDTAYFIDGTGTLPKGVVVICKECNDTFNRVFGFKKEEEGQDL